MLVIELDVQGEKTSPISNKIEYYHAIRRGEVLSRKAADARHAASIAMIDQNIATYGPKVRLGRVIIVDESYSDSSQPIAFGMSVDLLETCPKPKGDWVHQLRGDTST